jgi:hypothetical protein
MSSNIDISILLPTRGRTEALKTSLISLAELADRPQSIEMLLAFDEDDMSSFEYFQENIAPELTNRGIKFTAIGFPRLGYIRLNEYVNALAAKAQGRWLMFWGDDAIMESAGWDQRIAEVEKFRVLRIPTHNQHPYAIFPIVPKKWIDMFGYVSAHQLSDSWCSQVAYLANIMQNIDVKVTHDRFDITGNNKDTTWENRPMLEGNPTDPRDFNHVSWRGHRIKDADKIANYLESQGEDISRWKLIMTGDLDPWDVMTSPEQDPNKQIARFKFYDKPDNK